VRASHNEVRLTPPSLDGQRTLHEALAITPAVRPLRYVDYWGTTVHAFDIDVPHTELVVVATATVETPGPRTVPVGAGWTDLAEPAVRDRFAELLTSSRSGGPYARSRRPCRPGCARPRGPTSRCATSRARRTCTRPQPRPAPRA